MKTIAGTMMVMAAALFVASCGDARLKVSTSGEDTTSASTAPATEQAPPVVVQDTVHLPGVVVQDPDTVVRQVPSNQPPSGGSDVNEPSTSSVSAEEKLQIDAWLVAHSDSLNQYGDPIDMMYTGGTPLFNESTGKSIDKYDYIVSKHPDRPWRQ